MRFSTKWPIALAFLAVPLAGYAAPDTAVLAKIVAHHLSSAEHGGIEALMSDYAADAVLVTPDTSITGKPAIRAVFQRLVGGNASAPGAQPGRLQVQKQVYEGNVGYLLWVQFAGTHDEVRGSDTFIFRNGKIVAQTVVTIPVASLQR
jgi:ketosteroid isomerase-like protein